MARSVWSGSISFGLVNVPVKAHTAVRDHDVHFNQLEKKTGARVHNQKVGKKGTPLESDDIEMGFEVTSGRYVTFEKGELDDLKPESTKAVEVSDFVALADIDPIYYERTYWLAPDGDAATKAYGLLLAAMEGKERVGIGTVVMRNKQYLAAIRPLDGALAMSTMRFADEVVPKSLVDGLPRKGAGKPDAKQVKLAEQLVDSLASDWDPTQYADTFTDELKAIIARKEKGEDVVESDEEEAPKAEVLDLMAALEASVASAKERRSAARSGSKRAVPKKAAAKKKAPAKKAAAKKAAAAKRKAG